VLQVKQVLDDGADPADQAARRADAELRPEIESELAALYEDGRGLAEGALRDHGEQEAADALPEICPYTLERITAGWWPS
jgi:hypothetical protein